MEASDAQATIEGLTAFAGRGAGSDAERRAGNWLAARCRDQIGEAEIDTFWSRPNWALAHLWHVALAVAGSLIALASPIAGIVLLGIALISVVSDALTGVSLGRRLTPERASQNVRVPATGQPTTRLVLTANYDAGRIGLAYRLRPLTSRVAKALRGFTPGWLGWLTIALLWLLAVAVLRAESHTSKLIGAIQLLPTVGLVIGFALLIELATGNWSPAANDNATGVAVALQVAASLAAAPPQHLDLEILLTGAGDAEQIGLRRYLRAQRGTRKSRQPRSNTIVVGIAASGGGAPRWWQSDGAFFPVRYAASMRRIAADTAEEETYLDARPHRGRGNQTALPARLAGRPALTIGCLDARGTPPASHSKADTAVDPKALERAASFTLLLIDGIDAAVGEEQRRGAATPA
ncbi:MAG TPA: M28 family peptidase [Solirubrobacteraceae bacterium]|nr:M28 family peptidase [Solirubrobacteraceae bacterium]